MSKYVITLTKSEIEGAILDRLNREVTIRGRKSLMSPRIEFRDRDGSIGYFEADVRVGDEDDREPTEEELQP